MTGQAQEKGKVVAAPTGSAANGPAAKSADAAVEEKKQPERAGRIIKDPELIAQQDIVDVLDSLNEDTRSRVTLWLMQRYGKLHFAGALADVTVLKKD